MIDIAIATFTSLPAEIKEIIIFQTNKSFSTLSKLEDYQTFILNKRTKK